MKGYIFAAAIGYAIGTLFAPRKGCELRADIVDQFKNLQEKGLEVARSGQDRLSDVVEQGQDLKDQAKERLNRASESLNEAKHIAAETVTNLGKNIKGIVADNGLNSSN